MKISAADSRISRDSVDDSKLASKYNALTEDYLELQKDYVSKKKKLQTVQQKREILLDEVRFLRKRHIYLMESQFSKIEPELGPRQSVDLHDMPLRMGMNNVVNETNIKQKVNRNQKGELVKKALSIKK